MDWTVENARVRIGLQPDDNTRDDDLIAAMLASQQVAEHYCGRGIVKREAYEETLNDINGRVIHLWAFPIESFDSLVDEDDNDIENPEYIIINDHGRIKFTRNLRDEHGWKATYTGGYDPLPEVVVLAFWMIFDEVFAELDANSSVSSGEIKAINIAGVGQIQYDFSVRTAASGTGSALIPLRATVLLAEYRRIVT